MTDFNRCQLYLITPPRIDLSSFADTLAQTLEAGRVACLQLGLSDTTGDDIKRAIDILKPIAQDRGVAFLLNDDPDLAAMTGCDGVHIGHADTTYEQARQKMGPNAIVGVACDNSRHLAMEAAEQGADYITLSGFFQTAPTPPQGRPDIEILHWWSQDMTVPVVATGGITVANCAPLISAGTDFLAVASGVWDDPKGAPQAVVAFNRLFKETPRHS